MIRREWMREKEAAAYLKMSRSLLWKLRSAGLPFYKVGRSVRYEQAELDEWMESHRAAVVRFGGRLRGVG